MESVLLDVAGHRLRALIVLLWRAELRISEALALQESDLDRSRGAVVIRRGKGGKRREVGMDRWAWEQLDPWLEIRHQLPLGAVLCVIHGPTAGRRWEAFRGAQAVAPCRRRCLGETPVRAAPAAACPCGRNRTRRRSTGRDPAPARTRQPRDHQCLPAGHRQQRDRVGSARASRPDALPPAGEERGPATYARETCICAIAVMRSTVVGRVRSKLQS
jgi:hypothetical protein